MQAFLEMVLGKFAEKRFLVTVSGIAATLLAMGGMDLNYPRLR